MPERFTDADPLYLGTCVHSAKPLRAQPVEYGSWGYLTP